MSKQVKNKIQKLTIECYDILNSIDQNEIEIRKCKVLQRKLLIILQKREEEIKNLQKKQLRESGIINVSDESD